MVDYLNRFAAAMLLASPLAFLPTLLSPSLILIGSPEFQVPVESWVYLFSAFLVVALVLAMLLAIAKGSAQIWLSAFCSATFLVGFLVVIYFPEGGRRLDGIEAEAQPWTYYLWVYLVYAIAVFAVTYIFHKFRTSLSWLVHMAFVISIAIAGYAFATQERIPLAQNRAENVDLDPATDLNVIFIIADMLQGSSVDQFLLMEPRFNEQFSGFTAYTRATSPFPFTNFGLPAILSGELYSIDEPTDFRRNLQAAQQDGFVSDAKAAGYAASVVGFDQLRITEDQHSYEEHTNPILISALLGDLGLTRLTKLSGIVADQNAGTKMLVNLKRESLAVLERWMEADKSEHRSKITVVHNFIPHSPTYYSTVNLVQPKLDWRVLEANVPNYFEEMGFFFHKMSDVFDHLKALGVYEDALIVVTGDHGHFIGGRAELYDKYPGAEDFKGYERGGWARSASMYNPLIMVKPRARKGS